MSELVSYMKLLPPEKMLCNKRYYYVMHTTAHVIQILDFFLISVTVLEKLLCVDKKKQS